MSENLEAKLRGAAEAAFPGKKVRVHRSEDYHPGQEGLLFVRVEMRPPIQIGTVIPLDQAERLAAEQLTALLQEQMSAHEARESTAEETKT